jgi:uncharacterized protein
MLSPKKKHQGLIVPGTISIPFSYAAGKTASRFLTELRDNRRIMGRRCPECRRTWVAPQLICVQCFVELDEWVELGVEGELVGFTKVAKPKSHQPDLDSLVYGIIRLDGADNNFIHLVHCDNPDGPAIGMRVKAVFSEDRQASVLDISHFRPVGETECA